jgi:hypothetical protein
MTYQYAFVKWLGSASLVMAMAGCPSGDDGDTGAETNPLPTTSVGNESTTGEELTGTTVQATTMPGETTSDPDTSGGVTCDPPCDAGQECVGGTCFDMPGDSTTGEPPMECGLAVMLSFPNPACGPCAEDACCAELQGCFGDETTMEMTECLQLNNCIAMNCATAMTLMEAQACVDEMCTDFAASFNTWIAYQSCLGMNCMAECS